MLRFFKHIFSSGFKTHLLFPRKSLGRITEAVVNSEKKHRGEIRVCIESYLSPMQILRKISGRDRALDVFSQLRVWDTEENNGVLIYILIADHDIEILADRGVLRNAPENFWDEICGKIEVKFHEKKFEEGIIQAIDHISKLLQEKYPKNGHDDNELPDRPYLI
jgi:uncharacterized membrane protein